MMVNLIIMRAHLMWHGFRITLTKGAYANIGGVKSSFGQHKFLKMSYC